MRGKLSRLQDLPHSKMMRKLVVPETQYPQGIHAQLFRLFTMLRLGAQILFSATKICVSGRITETHLQRSALSPRRGRDDFLQVF